MPRRPGDYPPRRHKLLRDRQHRSAAAARRVADARRADGGGDRLAGPICREIPRFALPGLHAFPAGPADDRRQAGVPLGLRLRDGPGRNRTSRCRPQGVGQQGHHRHAGQFPGTVPRRPRQGAQARGTRSAARSVSTPPTPSAGRPIRGRSIRRCWACFPAWPKAPQDGDRSAALGPSQGSGRAVREGADRLVGDGLQAEPDAAASGFARWRGSS